MSQRGMAFLLVFGLSVSQNAIAAAATASGDIPVTISKTRKGKAIVHYDESFDPKSGEVYILTKKGVAADAKPMSLEEGRHHLLEMNMNLGFLTTKTSGASAAANSIDTAVKYGWNHGTTEFGPAVAYQFVRAQDTDSKTLLLGGFFDWNFSPNTATTTGVTALRLTAAIGQNDNSSQTSAASVNQFTGGFVYKWFGLSNNVAFDIDLSYLMKTASLSGANTTTSGLTAVLGLITYF